MKSKPPDVPDEVAVALCIYGVELIPEEISDLLGAKPTHSHRLGEKKTPESKPYAKGAWILEIRRTEPIDLDAMYEELLASLPTNELVWKSLASRFEVRIDLAVHTDSGCGFYVSPKTMKLIAAKQAEFYLDIHAYGADEA
jgi:Domain of unknown function (DUF4279)